MLVKQGCSRQRIPSWDPETHPIQHAKLLTIRFKGADTDSQSGAAAEEKDERKKKQHHIKYVAL